MTALDRKQWLRDRQTGIGGTDIAAIAGVGFRSAAEVYAEKIGSPEDRGPLPIMRLGLALESHNADLYAERFLGPDDALLTPGLVRTASPDWQFATFDRLASHRRPGETDAFRVVELKYVRWFGDQWGDDGSDMIPDAYSIQATWQHAVALAKYPSRKLEQPHLAALDSSGEQRVFTVQYSDRLAALLLDLANDFWQRVLRREEVGPDWRHPLSDKIADEVATVRANTMVRLDDEAQTFADQMDEAAALKARSEKVYKFAKGKLREILGDREVGILPDGRRVKQYAVAERLISPRPYLREQRVDLRILGAGKSERRSIQRLPESRPLMIEAGDEECILPTLSKGKS